MTKPNGIISTTQLNNMYLRFAYTVKPINVVVYHDPSGRIILGEAWRLDAFSAYPFRT